MIMVDVYNLYIGGYLPKVEPKTNVHNRRELKSKYRSIVSMNNANPLVMVRMSNETQAYALKVKEMSMEINEATQKAIEADESQDKKNMSGLADMFNALLDESDRYGQVHNRPSRPGGELRNLVTSFREEILSSGIKIDDKSHLVVPTDDESAVTVPSKFVIALRKKTEQMGMNPMEYVEKKVYSYAHLHRSDLGTAYESSIYSGMLFNSYC